MKSACFRRLTPLNSFAGARCDATCYPRGQCFSTGLSCTVREAERCRASARAMRRWETSSGAPETGLEHCAQVSRGCRARGAPGLKGPWVDGWVVTWAMGPCGLAHTRAMRGAHAGDAWRGAGYGLVHPRVLTAWEGRLCVGRARGVLPCSRALSRSTAPLASKGVPRLSRRGGKTRGARGWWRQRRRGGPRRRGRGDGGGARVWTATTRAERARRTATKGR